MKKTINLRLKPDEAFSDDFENNVLKKSGLANSQASVQILKRSIDARKKNVLVNVQADVFINEKIPLRNNNKDHYCNIKDADRVIIIGAGPAGLFAALRLIELGKKPIVIERGKDVRQRRRDIAAINKEHIVNSESNYCFGEGGAGTYSDGKLYTRSKKRGDLNRILDILVAHGAKEDILFDAHPHIGTNKLPKIVQAIRETIIDSGGEVHFESRMTDLIIESGELKGVEVQDGTQHYGESVILATGHSARDIFDLLKLKEVSIEAKPFALGVRVEHPQSLIDSIQYSCSGDRGEYLPASSYSLVSQTYLNDSQRGVFSFCMCPGGFIVPSATAPGEVVVNGMSPSRRDSKFANSGIVVAIEKEDYQNYNRYEELAGVYFQSAIEKQACQLAGGNQTAPGQKLVDFTEGRVSSSLLETSYQPGLVSVNMQEVLPDFISIRLKKAFRSFGKKMRGYLTNEAQVVGVESRTSSPVRIPRKKETLEHIELKRLFPCGEGAGYAGGIVSAAMDGERCAEAVVKLYAN